MLLKTVREILEEREWDSIDDIEVYFYWNKQKTKNSGCIHIKSKKYILGFGDGETVSVLISGDLSTLLIIGEQRYNEKIRGNEKDHFRILTQGNLKYQDFDFKFKPLFKLMNINSTIILPGKKVRACNYEHVSRHKFAILVDLTKLKNV